MILWITDQIYKFDWIHTNCWKAYECFCLFYGDAMLQRREGGLQVSMTMIGGGLTQNIVNDGRLWNGTLTKLIIEHWDLWNRLLNSSKFLCHLYDWQRFFQVSYSTYDRCQWYIGWVASDPLFELLRPWATNMVMHWWW